MRVRVVGAGGRLGSHLVRRFEVRGDTVAQRDINYLVFAHRYRGAPDFSAEIEVNVGLVAKTIDETRWAAGDCAILVVSSINATEPTLSQSLAYNVSKAALNNLARWYAKKGGVRVNTVSPNTFTGANPVVTIDQVSDVILFMCSPEASGINGQDIRIDGAPAILHYESDGACWKE